MLAIATNPRIFPNKDVFSVVNFLDEPFTNKGECIYNSFLDNRAIPCRFLWPAIQSITVSVGKYFSFMTCDQRPKPSIIPQTFLAARACEKRCIFFNPHPPRFFGTARHFHEGSTRDFLSFEPDHKKYDNWLIFPRIYRVVSIIRRNENNIYSWHHFYIVFEHVKNTFSLGPTTMLLV
jgi:hypothetical protein